MYRWNHPDGSIRHYWEMAEPVYDANGQVQEWRGTTQDVTPLKQAEAQTLAAKMEAEIANRARTEMLATMSHELRTPLNAIIGFSQMFLGQVFGPLGNEKYMDYAADILNSGNHLLELIGDILDVSAIETGEITIDLNDVDVSRQARNMIRLVQPRAARGKVTIQNDCPADIPLLHADERRIGQILLNLLSNAVKFTEPGGVVRCAARIDGNGDMVVSVSDTGIGMSEADISEAMKPFVQIRRDGSGIHEGTGLGLPLTASLIRLHDGTMTVESTPGEGTTVTVRFPKERVRPRQGAR